MHQMDLQLWCCRCPQCGGCPQSPGASDGFTVVVLPVSTVLWGSVAVNWIGPVVGRVPWGVSELDWAPGWCGVQ